ncbi:hypothetical protein, partial [Pseudomonas aeruginosa]|uniref:hypothetical protein n=1 Tax=Pseudomonas aeruginosa TaxID=287 RepID=UPI002E80688F
NISRKKVGKRCAQLDVMPKFNYSVAQVNAGDTQANIISYRLFIHWVFLHIGFWILITAFA